MNRSRLGRSIGSAVSGLIYVFKNEKNFSVQIVVGIIAVASALLLNMSRWEIIGIVLLGVIVLTFEILNSAVEKICDLLKPRLEERAKIVKDIAAAAVLLAAFGAALIGFILFLPHIIKY